jgi:hypothetical protein
MDHGSAAVIELPGQHFGGILLFVGIQSRALRLTSVLPGLLLF